VIKELLRDGKLPLEIEADIKDIIQYVGKTENLKSKI